MIGPDMALSSSLVEVRGSMNVWCRMKAAGALASAVPRSIGPRRNTQGRFREALGGLGPRRHLGESAPTLDLSAAGLAQRLENQRPRGRPLTATTREPT